MTFPLGVVVSSISEAKQLDPGLVDFIEVRSDVLLRGSMDVDVYSVDALRFSNVPVRVLGSPLPRFGAFSFGASGIEEALSVARRSCSIAAGLGAKLVVVGSRAARTAPKAQEVPMYRDGFLRFVGALSKACGAFGVEVVAEPLHPGETNVFNSVAELVAALDGHELCSEVGVAIDSYHVRRAERSLEEEMLKGARRIRHAHLSPAQRSREPDGSDVDVEFVEHLRRSGYAGLLTIEGVWSSMSNELPRVVAQIRGLTGQHAMPA